MIDLQFIASSLNFLFEANICLASFALVYMIVLRKQTQFQWQRLYIISALLVSITIASSSITFERETPVSVAPFHYSLSEIFPAHSDQTETIVEQSTESNFELQAPIKHWPLVVFSVFIIGAIYFLLEFLIIWTLLVIRLQRSSYFDERLGAFVTSHFRTPFAFMHRIYIPESLLGLPQDELDQVIAHERAHNEQLHMIDHLLMLLSKSLFWYNPIYWFLLKELRFIQEYQVDQTLMAQFIPESYSRLLIKLNQHSSSNDIVFPFSQNLIKKRVEKLNQSKSNVMKKGLFFLSAPLALILFLNFSIQFTEHVDPLANNPENKSNSMGFILPIEMHSVTKYTPFGMRMDPKFKNRKMHVGIDLTAAEGTQIFAAESGQVLSTEYNENGYGNKIVIRHNDSVSTTYAHLASIAVEKGQKVYQGDVIGACGNTGKSSGPHLHFEVLLNDSFIDPEPLIQLGDLSATLGSSLVNKSELVVIIDPGHGGEDKGVSNDFLSEKDLTLSYAITLAEELKNQNIRAVLTRQSDEMVSLKDRVNLTSEYAEALFISLHVNNAENKDAKGVEIYIPGEEELNHDKSKQFGVALGKVIQENNIENRGINTAGFYVLKSSACPSVIIEVGFMSSEMERINSEEYRASLCKVIASSIDFYAE